MAFSSSSSSSLSLLYFRLTYHDGYNSTSPTSFSYLHLEAKPFVYCTITGTNNHNFNILILIIHRKNKTYAQTQYIMVDIILAVINSNITTHSLHLLLWLPSSYNIITTTDKQYITADMTTIATNHVFNISTVIPNIIPYFIVDLSIIYILHSTSGHSIWAYVLYDNLFKIKWILCLIPNTIH